MAHSDAVESTLQGDCRDRKRELHGWKRKIGENVFIGDEITLKWPATHSSILRELGDRLETRRNQDTHVVHLPACAPA